MKRSARKRLVQCFALAGTLGLVSQAPVHAKLYSLPLPALHGVYAGQSDQYHTSPFDFGQSFPLVNRAWLRIEGPGNVSVSAHAVVDGGPGPYVADTAAPLDLEVPLAIPESVLGGTGIIELHLEPQTCCDWQTYVTSATLWFESTAVPGVVLSHGKISDAAGGFSGGLNDDDGFGTSMAPLADLDGDGVLDLAVGAPGDDDGGVDRGAVWVLFLNSDGTVRTQQKISDSEGEFNGALGDHDRLGVSLTLLGDLEGDGVGELAAGAELCFYCGKRGAVWVLFLDADGTVGARQKIGSNLGGFTGTLDPDDLFGWGLAALGDLDGDGIRDLAVGAPFDDDGGAQRGAVWLLFLNPNGTVREHQKISATQGGFAGPLDDNSFFGGSLAGLGDLDADGVPDLAAGGNGTVWVLFLNPNGTVKAHQRIDATEGGFDGTFGVLQALSAFGDSDGDLVADLAVQTTPGTDGRGGVWMLFLNRDGTVKGQQGVSNAQGTFTGPTDLDDSFGAGLAALGDFDGDCMPDLAVGAPGDDDGGSGRGAVWMLSLGGSNPVSLRVNGDFLSWCTPSGSTGYDVVRGDLAELRASSGDFTVATEECLANDHPGPALDGAPSPGPGEGLWFLVRRVTPDGNGTYDTGAPSQVEGRDVEIAASGADCP